MTQEWNEIYNETDVNKAYNKLLNIFTSLYNKHCSIKVYKKT